MNYRLIMLPQHILCCDEEITKHTKPCYCYNPIKKTWDEDVILYQGVMPMYHYEGFKKIIAGIEGLPKLDLSLIAEKIGWVDVKELAYTIYPINVIHTDEWKPIDLNYEKRLAFIVGFTKSQSLNEKKYSDEDLRKAVELARTPKKITLDGDELIDKVIRKHLTEDEIIQSLSKPKAYDVVVEMEYCENCGGDGIYIDNDSNRVSCEIYAIHTESRPKITNNTIKVTKIIS